MTKAQLERVQALFEEAARVPLDDRDAWLADRCADDAHMHELVARMLKSDSGGMGEFLNQPIISDEADSADSLPERVGQYRIVRVLGKGGMGTVFEARQENPDRSVAVKVIRPSIAQPHLLRRFEYESQVLARLRHPGIAQVFEAGTHQDGQTTVPYFAMEYVPGALPLTDYAAASSLGIRARLRLFAQVCDAVHHGHQKGIIHRDLKPANILVDGEGQVKVIDFGVARATDSDVAVTQTRTGAGALVGTLQYMSPEQVQADPHDLDVRSDIYTLGVILYELLTGELPYDVRHAPLYEAVRVIREEQPIRPSTIARPLRGDIETIILKALEKDRERRYQSADDLARDVRCYLVGELVSARPPSMTYRVRVFARRNKAVVASLALVLIVLTVASVFSTWQYVLADAARADAIAAGREAEARRVAEGRERKRAEAVTDFITDALVSADPNEGGAQMFLVVDAMDQAVASLDAGALKDEPETEASLRLTFSRILNGNARSEEALDLAQQALQINERLHPGDHPEVAASLSCVAESLHALGRTEEALGMFQSALEMEQRLFAGDHLDVALSLNNVANCLHSLGHLEEALPKYESALKMLQRIFPADHPDVALSLNNVGACLRSLGQPEEALPYFEEALDMRRRLFEGDHPDIAKSLNNLGACLQSLGRWAEALPNFEAAWDMAQRLFEGDHPDVARNLTSLADCLTALGQSEEALPRFEEALEMKQRLYQEDHPTVAIGLNGLANCLTRLGRSAEALPKYEAALQMQQRIFGGDHPSVASSMSFTGTCLESMGRSEEALQRHEAALEMRERLYEGDHPEIATNLSNVADCLQSLDRPAEALPKLESARDMLQRLFQGDHPRLAVCLNNLGVCLKDLGRNEEALLNFQAATEMFRRVLPVDHPHTLHPLIESVKVLIKLGRHVEAEALLLDAAEQCERSDACRKAYWKSVIKQSIRLYDAWHEAEPNAGHDHEAAEWRGLVEVTDDP